jgi:hypothetical protein
MRYRVALFETIGGMVARTWRGAPRLLRAGARVVRAPVRMAALRPGGREQSAESSGRASRPWRVAIVEDVDV